MEDGWIHQCTGSSEGWEYVVETQERGGTHFVRIKTANRPFRALDGSYESEGEAVAAATAFATGWIRDQRSAEGYPEA